MATNSTPEIRTTAARRAASRARPEQVFFDDPAVDRLMGVVMALATEHYVLRDRVRALEEQLAKAGLAPAGMTTMPAGAEEVADASDAAEFAEELLRPLLGLQPAAGATGAFSLKTRRRRKRK
ncbi:MAG TPA: hypothetical protein VJ011_01480 [Steroidobacteraceae bacterium]|nr:hypothetical protein [Steroidobacteraceae bacterium]